jgi:hypothetical protein
VGQPGNTEYLVHVARHAAEIYRDLIEWTEDFQCVPNDNRSADDPYSAFIAKFSAAGIQMLTDIEKFSEKFSTDIETALSVPTTPDETIHVEGRLVLSFPSDLAEELGRLLQVV